MRRMNYNPFETPFASGECSERNFLIDKALELDSIYFIVIFSPSDFTTSTTILSTYRNDIHTQIFYSSALVDFDINGNRNYFFLEYDRPSNEKLINIQSDNISCDANDRIIYIYKIA